MEKTRDETSVLKKIDDVICKIVLIFAVTAAILTFVMALSICVAVVLRYFFHRSVAWSTELSEYVIYIDVMLATPYVLKIDKHVRVDVFIRLISPKVQHIVEMVLSAIGMLACLMICVYSAKVTMEYFASKVLFVRVIPMQKWIVMLFVPVMALLSTYMFARRIYIFNKVPGIVTAEDYMDRETALQDPRYNTSATTDVILPKYDEEDDAAVNETEEGKEEK